MKGILLGVSLMGAVLLAGAVPAFAEPLTPGGGPAFGQHVSGMAPDHAKDHGAVFGECVSTMAQGAGCSH